MALTGRRPPPVYSPVSLRALAASALRLGTSTALEQLNAALRDRFAAAAVLLTDSGTSALMLAIVAALKQRPGASVALPAYSCYDLATAAVGANVPVVLYDVDPATLGPDWSSLDRALQRGAGAVVVAHLYGVPVDLTRVAVACASSGAVLIEDAAQGIGGRWNEAPLGAHGPLSVLSFGRGKGVTGGAGGALLARGDGVRLVENAAITVGGSAGTPKALMALAAQWLLARPHLYAIPSSLPFLRLGETVYREPHPARGLGRELAAIVLDALAHADHEAEARRRHALAYHEAVAAAGVASVRSPSGSQPGYLRFPLLAPANTPDASVLGVMPGYPIALGELDAMATRCANREDHFPGARILTTRLRTAPTHSRISGTDVDRVVAWLRSIGEGVALPQHGG